MNVSFVVEVGQGGEIKVKQEWKVVGLSGREWEREGVEGGREWEREGGREGGREWRVRLTTQWLNPGVRTSIPTIGERRWFDTKMAPVLSLRGFARKIAPCRIVNTQSKVI